MEMPVKLPNKFRRHSASGMIANKIFQTGLLAGHQVYKFDAIDILNRSDGVSRKVSVLCKEMVRQFVHIKTTIINYDL
jgi:hypothetical protein